MKTSTPVLHIIEVVQALVGVAGGPGVCVGCALFFGDNKHHLCG